MVAMLRGPPPPPGRLLCKGAGSSVQDRWTRRGHHGPRIPSRGIAWSHRHRVRRPEMSTTTHGLTGLTCDHCVNAVTTGDAENADVTGAEGPTGASRPSASPSTACRDDAPYALAASLALVARDSPP